VSRPVVTALVWLLVLLTAVTGVVAVALEPGGVDKGALDIAWMAMLQGSAVIWSLVGAVLLVKRPGNRLGWLLLLGSLGLNTGAAAAALLFGFGLAITFQVPQEVIPLEFIQMLPYILTIVALAAIGKPYRKE
jgi:hypothetical protein